MVLVEGKVSVERGMGVDSVWVACVSRVCWVWVGCVLCVCCVCVVCVSCVCCVCVSCVLCGCCVCVVCALGVCWVGLGSVLRPLGGYLQFLLSVSDYTVFLPCFHTSLPSSTFVCQARP